MGIVAAVTPSTKQTRCVPRRKVMAIKLSEAGKIKVHHHEESVAREVCELGILPSAGPGIWQLGLDFRASKESRWKCFGLHIRRQVRAESWPTLGTSVEKSCKQNNIYTASASEFATNTSLLAKYHSLHVYIQIRGWKDSTEDMNYEDWGWRLAAQHQLTPIMSDLPPAPQLILQIVWCNCSQDCSTQRCSCCKNNLQRTPACGKCKGSGCTNSPGPIVDDEDSVWLIKFSWARLKRVDYHKHSLVHSQAIRLVSQLFFLV